MTDQPRKKKAKDLELKRDFIINLVKVKTNMRHGNINDFESCVPKIDETYDNEDVYFDRQGFGYANPGF